ncbi:TssN family type VI secretion system protein [Hymenobacter cavernae]|uniref:Uncharacterized protein n=1 Tax=Hymenobacter cavernae TaxID=2044852 RepID=A0ABQ1UTA3_9BACT|nr:TssN family type VI secretion system protein [Hymenobacter cavernae]GGF26603.1 hypothetical protein GCM10011383_42660 [Hymenobacter cavernae]
MLQPNLESQGRSAAGNVFSGAQSSLRRNRVLVGILLYLLGSFVVFGLVGLAGGYSPLAFRPTFLLGHAVALGLGIAHLGLLPWALPWFEPDNRKQGTLLTLGAAVAGALGIVLLQWLPKIQPLTSPVAFVPAVLPFVLPYFFYQAYLAWNQIPDSVYKLWYYRANAPGPDLARVDLNNFMVVHFWMARRYGESLYHDFSSKAPYEMRFSDLFHIFLTDYNVMKPEQAIQYLDEQGRSFGWLFYAKQPWWKPRRYYDPDHTFRDNFIRQGNIIVARRVPAPSGTRET